MFVLFLNQPLILPAIKNYISKNNTRILTIMIDGIE